MDQAVADRRNAMLLLAAAIFVAGHGQAALLALCSLSPATLSTLAAGALVVAALWSEAAGAGAAARQAGAVGRTAGALRCLLLVLAHHKTSMWQVDLLCGGRIVMSCF